MHAASERTHPRGHRHALHFRTVVRGDEQDSRRQARHVAASGRARAAHVAALPRAEGHRAVTGPADPPDAAEPGEPLDDDERWLRAREEGSALPPLAPDRAAAYEALTEMVR